MIDDVDSPRVFDVFGEISQESGINSIDKINISKMYLAILTIQVSPDLLVAWKRLEKEIIKYK